MLSRRGMLAGCASALVASNLAMSKENTGPGHLVLLGDSILDNKVYVHGQPDVTARMREALPGWTVTLLARDGNVSTQIPDQMKRLPTDATHLLMSVGGNDALRISDILTAPVQNASEVFLKLASIRDEFEKNYSAALEAARKSAKPLTVCTIYDPNFVPGSDRQKMSEIGLTVFNDVIIREATRWGIPILDLRAIFTSPLDYANPIEPSSIGAKKIAEHARTIFKTHDFRIKQTTWHPSPFTK